MTSVIIETMITERDRLLKIIEGGGAGTFAQTYKSDGKSEGWLEGGLRHLMKLATSNPAISEPFRAIT